MRTTTSFFNVNRLMCASAPLLIATLIACSDASTEPTANIAAPDVALASELEMVAQNARAAGDSDGLKWATIHADIIRKFGRFPHRNALLGRKTTADEQKFLDEGGFAG